jgi:hypothetical protein
VKPTLYARLDGKGWWVVCVRCGEQFARQIPRIAKFQPPPFVLDFKAGWLEHLGIAELPIWTMSKRTRKKLSQGRPATLRRVRLPSGEHVVRRSRERAVGFSTNARPTRLPAIAICPNCQLHQLVDPSLLDMP